MRKIYPQLPVAGLLKIAFAHFIFPAVAAPIRAQPASGQATLPGVLNGRFAYGARSTYVMRITRMATGVRTHDIDGSNIALTARRAGNITAGAGNSPRIPPTAPGTVILISTTGMATMKNNFISTGVIGTSTGDKSFKASGTIFSPQGGGC